MFIDKKMPILLIVCGILLVIAFGIIQEKTEIWVLVLGIMVLIIGLLLLFIYIKSTKATGKNLWNKFVKEICDRDLRKLTDIQKNAVLCFWYDTEMGSGGHNGFFSMYDDLNYKDLEKAIRVVANKEIADNFKEALVKGKKDNYVKTDKKYYYYTPALADYLDKYIEKYKEDIFK